MNSNIYNEFCDDFDFEDIFRMPEDTDHLLTNFGADELQHYQAAVAGFGDETLYISENAFDRYGNIMEGNFSLRSKEYKDRSDFWNLFRAMK